MTDMSDLSLIFVTSSGRKEITSGQMPMESLCRTTQLIHNCFKKPRDMKRFTSIVSLFFLCSAVAFSGNKIHYVTTDNQPITPNAVEMGVHIISNTYTEASDMYPEGCWTLEFDEDIITVDGFQLIENLKSVTLPDGVITIALKAFTKCTNLQEINIPYGVTSIGGYAFFACDLRKIAIPTSVKRIEDGAFLENSLLADIELPETPIEEIGYYAFRDTKWWANYCADEKNIFGNTVYIYDIAYQAVSLDITECAIREGTRMIADLAFAYCRNLQEAHIPDGVESIGFESFYECDLRKVVIPASVRSIGKCAFQRNTWIDVELPETPIEEIGSSAFDGSFWWQNYMKDENNIYGNIVYLYDIAYLAASRDITECTFREDTRIIGDGIFAGCKKLSRVEFPEGITRIVVGMFSGCTSLKEITIPESVTEIGDLAFRGCTFETIDLPQSITEIGYRAFAECTFETIVLPQSITHIGREAFYSCKNLRKIALPQKNTRIEPYTFYYCSSLTEVDIPDGVNYIGSGAFASCQALEEITLPASIEFIGSLAFSNAATYRFYCPANKVPTAHPEAFNVKYLRLCSLLVPESLKAEYKATYPWSEFGGIYNIDGSDDIKEVSDDASHDPLQKWDLHGRELVQPAKGQIYLHQGRKKTVR